MPDATHAYVVFSGTYTWSNVERWQCGVRFMLVNSGSTPDNVGTLPTFGVVPASVGRTESAWDIVSNWVADLGLTESISPDDWLNDQLAPSCVAHWGGGLANTLKMDTIKVSPINASGDVVGGRTATLSFTSGFPGGSSSSHQLPTEVALVASWGTQVIGRRGRGRIYLPPASVAAVETDGTLTSSVQDTVLAWVTAWLEDLAITPTGLGNHWALPIVTGSPWTDYGVIVKVGIGNIFDAQRRRRRQLTEGREFAAPSYG